MSFECYQNGEQWSQRVIYKHNTQTYEQITLQGIYEQQL